jgi:NADH-quinone oxidoreductase subunit L
VFISVAVGLTGIAIAYFLYVLRPGLADIVADRLGGLYKLVYNKYFVDEIYGATVVRPLVSGSREVLWKGVDAGVIDGTVNGIGHSAQGIGGILRLLQSGYIRSYAAWVVIGSIAALVFLGLAGGAK